MAKAHYLGPYCGNVLSMLGLPQNATILNNLSSKTEKKSHFEQVTAVCHFSLKATNYVLCGGDNVALRGYRNLPKWLKRVLTKIALLQGFIWKPSGHSSHLRRTLQLHARDLRVSHLLLRLQLIAAEQVQHVHGCLHPRQELAHEVCWGQRK